MKATKLAWLARIDWVPVTIFSGVAVILGVMAAASYDHEYLLARGNDQAGWVAAVLPVSVDGLLVVAAVAIIWALINGARGWKAQPWRPYIALAVGIVATVGANLYSGLHYIWLQRAVSVWSGIAVVLATEVGMWYIVTRRKLATGETDQPASDCSHPPLPLTLAEWLPLARAELEEKGKPHGEQELANRMSTTRHQVKLALAPMVAALTASPGSPPLPPSGPLVPVNGNGRVQ